MFDQVLHHQQCAGIPIPMMEMDGRWKAPHVQQAPNCPRCASTNTKFCYYNNYSLAQPRYFCKACRRYWTKGGSLRNVPVGGGCRRKSRRSRSKHSSSHDLGPAASPLLQQPTSSSPQIDLAAVFARYVNQGPEATSSPVDLPTTIGDTSTEQDQYCLFDQVWHQENVMGSFDQGVMLQPEDGFWSTSTEEGSSLSPMTAHPELDYYSSSPLALYAASVLDHDQFTTSSTVSTNSLLDDFNWSCLDDQLTGYHMEEISTVQL